MNFNPYIFTLYLYCGLVVWYKHWRANKAVRANAFWGIKL